ncbi:MAG: carboxypeptidase regulatory-like domain-containing protein [Bacteroidia bacterium]|nr:carboxypeptidase regulatory-like domain-containing protein [Bacteroidia bacterium]
MKGLKLLLIFSIAVFLSVGAIAQNSKIRKANKLFDEGQFAKAIPLYQAGVQTGSYPRALEKLADCYMKIGDSENAEMWYEKAINTGLLDREILNKYARSMQRNGKYDKAMERCNHFAGMTDPGTFDPNFLASLEMAQANKREVIKYTVKPLPQLNTANSEVAEIALSKGIIFSSDAPAGNFGKGADASKKKKGGESTDFNFFSASMLSSNFYSDVKPVPGDANSKLDEMGAAMAPDYETVYFTRKVERKENKKKIQILEVHQAKFDDKNRWSDVKLVGAFGNDTLSSYHPAIHPDGEMIVFASDRKGGKGGSDLYVIYKEGDGWSAPQNMGVDINSPGNEDYPTFNEKGDLFFASDGHVGFGGFDIFNTTWSNGRYSGVDNMGPIINSPRDDFGLIWEPGKSSGYLTSNRAGSKKEDIYYFQRLPEIIGMVRDSISGNPISEVSLTLIDSEWKEEFGNSDEYGRFSIFLKPRDVYQLWVRAPGYKQKKMVVSAVNLKQGEDLVMNVKLAANKVLNLSGAISDFESGEGMADASLRVKSEDGVPESSQKAEENGNYLLKLIGNNEYVVIAEKEGYIPKIISRSLKDLNGLQTERIDFPLKKGDYVLVKGHVRKIGKGNLNGARINIIDNHTQEVVDTAFANSNGTFWIAIPWDTSSNMSIIASKSGFFSFSKHIEKRENKEVEIDLVMSPAEYGLDKTIKVIYYEYNKSNLDLLSKRDLNEIYYFMVHNPNAVLEVRSFTDSRGGDEYNRVLSIKRSKAVEEFILSRRQIPKDRIKSIGFGESVLVNDCDDGVDCTEEQHSENRRTEIVVLDR